MPIATQYGDLLTGDNKDNSIDGLGGDDLIYGNAGADTLIGNAGNDTIDPGAGVDHLFGGAGTDTVDYSYASGDIYADLSVNTGYVIAAGPVSDKDFYNSIENVTGSSFNDQIVGNA